MPAVPLIATKLHVPPARADLIPRPALFELFAQGLQAPLTLVSAPPGFGKTTLVAGWIHAHGDAGPRTGWLSLDESDNEPDTFWRYFIAALQGTSAGPGGTAGAMLSAAAAPAIQTVLATLINELAALEDSFLIVLDDYHLIRAPAIHQDLKFLLDHLPDNVHLVMLTREDPPMGLARRRARRQMVEIRAADLRFDPREAAEFLHGFNDLALTPEQIATLEQRTEGWIAGLQMAALSLQGRDPAEFFESFSGDNPFIADYLIEEVLQRQPEPLREFLLVTSILERFSAGLCAALGAEPAIVREHLDLLERANLFLIPLDNHREWYRYHHLFAELLRKRLRETRSSATIANLQRGASDWFEAQGDIPAAIRHARQIPDETRARHLLEQHFGEFYARGALPQLFEAASPIPPAQRENAPAFCSAVAWAALATNHFDAVEQWLKPIERKLGWPAEAAIDAQVLDPAERAGLLEVLVIRLQLPGSPQSAERLQAIRDQLNSLPPEQPCLFNVVANLRSVIAYDLGLLAENSGETALAASTFGESITLTHQQENWHLYHLARGHLASLQIAMGNLHAARQTYEEALSENTGPQASPYLSLLHAGMGTLCYEWNDLPASEYHFRQGLGYARLWSQWESLVPITIGLARLKQRAGATGTALALLDELGVPPLASLAQNLEAYSVLLQAMGGARTAPSAWLAARIAAGGFEPTPSNENSLLDVAHLQVELRFACQADELLQRVIPFAESSGRMRTLVLAKTAWARVLAEQGRTTEALSCILSVLPLAAPEGYLSTFIDEGESMRRLLAVARDRLAPGEIRGYVERILSAFPAGANLPGKRGMAHGLPELSERELEIVTLVAAGCSNQEIAARLVISITTVKTHVSNIFNKLGVTNRIQAITRAEDLGLLPRA